MPTLALVALSARTLAEAAARDGHGAVAIDLFGDLDTRRACSRWLPAGDAATLRIDAAQVLAHLQALACEGDVIGWVAGSGCEAHVDLLTAGAAVLPLIGTAAQGVARVRDVETLQAALRAHGLRHPDTRHGAPPDRSGWLVKDSLSSGGLGVQDATTHDTHTSPLHPGQYFQRHVQGRVMSATFCANGHDALLLGCNEFIAASALHPHRYGGVLGPVPVPSQVADTLRAALPALARDFELKGFGSLDFIFDGQDAWVLEINPRMPASAELYAPGIERGLMHAQLRACLHGELPRLLPVAQPVRAVRIVYTGRDVMVDSAASLALQARTDCHDLPAPGTPLRAGDPLCSVSAAGPDASTAQQRLQRAHDAALNVIESLR